MTNQEPLELPQAIEEEGVIKFNLFFSHASPIGLESIAELNAWRQILHRLGLTGRDPFRYQGLAYGNVSQRTSANAFIVSGTQTGAKEHLSTQDYCIVTDFNLEKNCVYAKGPIEPSSEALTHGSIYAANRQITCVLHAHSPSIWRNASRLGISQTSPSIAYGTPEMGKAVEQAAKNLEYGIIAMGGHEDGILAFAGTLCRAGTELVRYLAKAEQLTQLDGGESEII